MGRCFFNIFFLLILSFQAQAQEEASSVEVSSPQEVLEVPSTQVPPQKQDNFQFKAIKKTDQTAQEESSSPQTESQQEGSAQKINPQPDSSNNQDQTPQSADVQPANPQSDPNLTNNQKEPSTAESPDAQENQPQQKIAQTPPPQQQEGEPQAEVKQGESQAEVKQGEPQTEAQNETETTKSGEEKAPSDLSKDIQLKIKSYIPPYIYDPTYKKDPFSKPDQLVEQELKTAEEDRLHPVEDESIDQIKLRAIMWGKDHVVPRALFETSDGKAYTLTKNDRLGEEGSIIYRIDPDRILVMQPFFDPNTGNKAFKPLDPIRLDKSEKSIGSFYYEK